MTRIPETIEGVAALLTARKWHKAAIVWAYVDGEGGRGRPKKNAETSRIYNVSQFADLGLAGLSDYKTVRAYWKRWNDAINDGHAQPVAPGDEVVAPDLEWRRLWTDGRRAEQRPLPSPEWYEEHEKKEKQEKEERKNRPLIPELSIGCITVDMMEKTRALAAILQNNPLDESSKQLILQEVQEIRNGLDHVQTLLESPHSGSWDAALTELTDNE